MSMRALTVTFTCTRKKYLSRARVTGFHFRHTPAIPQAPAVTFTCTHKKYSIRALVHSRRTPAILRVYIIRLKYVDAKTALVHSRL